MTFKSVFLFMLTSILISSAAWGADLSTYYEKIRDDKETPDDSLDKIFDKETDAVKILEAVGSCSSRIEDKAKYFKKTADLALMMSRFDTAQRYYKRAFDAKPDDWESLYMSSSLLYEQGEFETAGEGFKTVNRYASSPLKEEALAMYGAFKLSMGMKDEGLKYLSHALMAKNDCTIYLVYDIASAFSLEDLKNAAARRLKAEGFEGRMLLSGALFPVTPSRVFLTSDYSQTVISKTMEVNKEAGAKSDDSKTVRRPSSIQVGSFGSAANAKNMEERLSNLGLKHTTTTVKSGNKTLYKVAVDVDAEMDVNNTLILLKDNGIESYFVF